jgi:hypothetical protein
MYQQKIPEYKIMGPTCNFFYILLEQICIQHSKPKQVMISERQIYELSSKFRPTIIKFIIIIIIIVVLCALVKLVFISC